MFIGYVQNSKAWLFMRKDYRLYKSDQALFIEDFFPRVKNEDIIGKNPLPVFKNPSKAREELAKGFPPDDNDSDPDDNVASRTRSKMKKNNTSKQQEKPKDPPKPPPKHPLYQAELDKRMEALREETARVIEEMRINTAQLLTAELRTIS